MLLVPRKELSAYFISNGSRFTNSEGMEISWSEEWGVFTGLSFYRREIRHFHETPIEMSISTSEESLDDSIEGFNIQRSKISTGWVTRIHG